MKTILTGNPASQENRRSRMYHYAIEFDKTLSSPNSKKAAEAAFLWMVIFKQSAAIRLRDRRAP
ncbi:hypothetical protein [Oricola sp.]|uniref:hypothetical protein n=1 Tax=Oricola sp. TaxID=1979950 RepID=UPI0025DB54C5|nr:hypothetical protein [Oricola sp.]MCI5074602.1 hypothetical protein [Oricola sp.]